MKLDRTAFNIISRLFHDSCFLMKKGFHSLEFSFPCAPCDYLLSGRPFEEVRVIDPLFVLHMKIFFLSCRQLNLATELSVAI